MPTHLVAACRLDHIGIIMTDNGPVRYGPGDFLVWGPAGEKFICREKRFLRAFPACVARRSS